ncbi:MAG: class I SAM-dependent methyltransferase [Nitrospirae bacterium]|nr:MAG: class I SAM-dependent methyltransferase [Nitrospirota bacterium]
MAKITYHVELPQVADPLEQDQEYCYVIQDGVQKKIRFHDYASVFSIPGLYEYVFHDLLQCVSPQTVASLLISAVKDAGEDPTTLCVLDLGAGSGLVAEQLHAAGVLTIVGVDINAAVKMAMERDRPHVYQRYFVGDIREDAIQRELKGYAFNGLTCVAALGFNDIPGSAFVAAYNLIAQGGWIAFNLKSDFLETPQSEFASLSRELFEQGALDVKRRIRYRHRYAVDGRPLYYDAIVGRKVRNLSDSCR